MAIKYPRECKTDADKNEFIRIAHRKLHEARKAGTIVRQEAMEIEAKLAAEQIAIKNRYLASKDFTINEANVRPDGVTIPTTADDNDKKLKFLYQAVAELRFWRNNNASMCRAGIISRAERLDDENVFTLRSKKLHRQINTINAEARKSTRFDPDITKLENDLTPIPIG